MTDEVVITSGDRAPELMSVSPNGHDDEVGTPDEKIAKCNCGTLFRVGGWHRCSILGRGIEWDEWQDSALDQDDVYEWGGA